jgi:stress response protein SCP2
MDAQARARPHALAYEGAMASLREVVFGVHWTPSASAAEAPDLDALCHLYDAQGRLHEAVHKDRPRNLNDSVVHTGDSRDGASRWDDERVFVFTDAVPQAVTSIAFIVRSADRRAFHEVPGAVCHLTHPASEHEWLRIDLTALRGRRSFKVATLQRKDCSWSLCSMK